jgi:GDP-L-fucose synthase
MVNIMPFLLRNKRIWIAGETGMVGRALLRQLREHNCTLLFAPHSMLDLRDQSATTQWIKTNVPDAIIVAAAKVGGIEANRSRPAEFLYDNLMISANIIHAAAEAKVKKLLYLGSSCVYPREAQQPITEDALLTGLPEPTNEAYAIAKIAGIKLCQSYRRQYGCDFISAMPCNLYGPGDHYDPLQSHVIPGLIAKLRTAQEFNAPEVTLWGTGTPRREFLHVDDLARALVILLQTYSDESLINIGSGEETTIAALAGMIAFHMGYAGRIGFDPAMPDGAPRKVLDSGRMRALGWAPQIPLNAGLKDVINLYLESERLGDAA